MRGVEMYLYPIDGLERMRAQRIERIKSHLDYIAEHADTPSITVCIAEQGIRDSVRGVLVLTRMIENLKRG